MADIKFSELTVTTTPSETDIFALTVDPSGTPLSRQVTVKDILDKRVNYSIVAAANKALTAGTGVQSAFDTTGDVFTLAGATTYEFEGQYLITKSGTTCTLGLAFALGGGATITSIAYLVRGANIAKNTTTPTVFHAWIDTVSSTVVNATATTDLHVYFKGLIRMNVGGTVTPQVNFSAVPTSPVMVANSYIKFTPIGTNVENNKGSVA